MIEQKLKNIWFTDKEIEIYLTINKYKHILPATISYLTKINRTTVYSILKILIDKNLVSEEIKDWKKEIICLPIENFNNIIYKQKIQLTKEEKIVSDIISDLQDSEDKKLYIPQVKTISHENIESYLYNNFQKWNKSTLEYDNNWWWLQDTLFPYKYIDWIDHVWRESPKEINLKLFSDNSEVEESIWDKFERRQIIFSENINNFDWTIWIIWDYIINVYLREKPYYMNEMYNPILAKNMRNVFQVLWKQEQKK